MTTTLCIDVGGTRIKTAVLPWEPTLEQVKAAPTFGIRTLGWLNHSLPGLLNPDHWPGPAKFYQRKGIHYGAVAMSFPGGIGDGMLLGRDDLTKSPINMPVALRHELESVSRVPVFLVNDAEAWAHGFIRYSELAGEHCEDAVVVLAFGTGLGVAVVSSGSSTEGFDIGAMPVTSWERLRALPECALKQSWEVHNLVGRKFFDDVDARHKEWTYLNIRERFTSRVVAALADMRPSVEKKHGKIRTVVLAGGNAEWVSVRKLADASGCRVVNLTEHHSKLAPDLISLLGVETAFRLNSRETQGSLTEKSYVL